MAFLDPYVTADQLKTYLKIEGTSDYDDDLEIAVESASREINNHTSRQFNREDVITSTSTETRRFRARYEDLAIFDDVWTTDDLEFELTDGTVLDPADYQLEPLNGIRDGNPGWPFFKIRLSSGRFVTGPFWSFQVTGHFGWAAVPKDVMMSCFMLAAESFKMREAPFGVAGWSEFGAVRVRDIPKVQKLLYPYELERVKARGA